MTGKRILVVEDEPDLRALIAEKLEAAGYTVYQAADGEEGFRMAQELRPDIVIADIIMPKKDGNQLFKELRQSDFGKDIPFIVLTARVAMKDYFEIVGVDYFVEKPFEMQELLTRIAQILSKKKPEAKKASKAKDSEKKKPIGQGKKADGVGEISISEQTESVIKEAMTVDYEKERKTKFSRDEEEKKEEQKEAVPKISVETAKKKIIVMADDTDEYEEMQRIFSQNGYAAEMVRAVAECMAEAQRLMPNLIIIKDMAGGVNAEELAHKLKEMPALEKIPIIVYSHFGRRLDRPGFLAEKGKKFIISQAGKGLIHKVKEILG